MLTFDEKKIESEVIKHRRYLHMYPELSLDLPKTKAYVVSKLRELGIEYEEMGKSGICAYIRGEKSGKTVLIRGDMDALPMVEEADLTFKSTNENMHACGHDFHTAMLLGAAEVLLQNKDKIEGTVKLMFQPGEEDLTGALMMIDCGILEGVDGALMIHMMPALNVKAGTILVADEGPAFASSNIFKIKVKGQGTHGAMPEKGADPIGVLCKIYEGLQNINAREISAQESIVLTIGEIRAGNIFNIIPESGYLSGNLRTQDKVIKDFVLKRVEEIVKNTAQAFRCNGELIIDPSSTIPLIVDGNVSQIAYNASKKSLGDEMVMMVSDYQKHRLMASEDFAFVADKVPTAVLLLASGEPSTGYHLPVHNPNTRFDEESALNGVKAYASFAIEFLKNN